MTGEEMSEQAGIPSLQGLKEGSKERKSAELYYNGKKLNDKGEEFLSKYKESRRKALAIQEEIDRLRKEYVSEMERSGKLLMAGHRFLDEAKELWMKSSEVLLAEAASLEGEEK